MLLSSARVMGAEMPKFGPIKGQLTSVIAPNGLMLDTNAPVILFRFSEPNPGFRCEDIMVRITFVMDEYAWLGFAGGSTAGDAG